MSRLEFEVVCGCVHAWLYNHMHIFVGVDWKKQPLVIRLSLFCILVCLSACVCRSEFPCVFVSACISGWGVQWSSRRTSSSYGHPQTAPHVLQSHLMISLTPSLSGLACVAATVWRLSLYMPFAASYPVKFNCTAQCRGISLSLSLSLSFALSLSPPLSPCLSLSLAHGHTQTRTSTHCLLSPYL